MRLLKVSLPGALTAVLGLLMAAAPAWALPIPKLPPEAKDKPGVVVRVKPLGDLIKDVGYIAKLVNQEEVFNAFEPGVQPVLDALDSTKPLGFYAKIRPAGIDSQGVLMLPVKTEKDFLGILATLGQNPTEGKDGLYTLNVAGAPFQIMFRFVGGYVYATVKNTPDAEANFEKNKLFTPDALFAGDDKSIVSVTVNVDAIPNDLKKKGLDGLEKGLEQLKSREFAKEKNAVVRNFLETVAEELGIKLQSLITDTQSISLKFDLDRAKEDLAFSFKLTPAKSTILANDIATLDAGQGIGAGLVGGPAAGSAVGYAAVPASLKKTFDTLIDEILDQAWKKADPAAQDLAKEVLDALAPTLRAGILDFGADFRGPGKSGAVSLVVAVGMKDGQKVEAALRKVRAALPEEKRKEIDVDVDTVAGVGIHSAPAKIDAKGQILFGDSPRLFFAFRKDAVMLGIGPADEALAQMKSALASTAKASKVFQGEFSIRNIAKIAERKDEGVLEAAKKVFPDNVSDTYRFIVSGGSSLDMRFSGSARIIQFGVLAEQMRRNR